MVDIPEHLLLRSAEARAKALGISVEQALAEMKGESTPTVVAEEPEVIEIDAPAPAKAEVPALLKHLLQKKSQQKLKYLHLLKHLLQKKSQQKLKYLHL
jgi:CelD/BcsL family acetyltransferase involved in cellulose biosynthesis